MNRALRPPVDQSVKVPAALPTRGVNDVRVRRIERDVGNAGVLAEAQDGLPGLAAVGGLVQSSIAARRPERPLRGDVNDFAVARVDRYAANVLGFIQADFAEAAPAVFRLVNAVAITDAALAVALPRSYPNHRRVFRIERDRAN